MLKILDKLINYQIFIHHIKTTKNNKLVININNNTRKETNNILIKLLDFIFNKNKLIASKQEYTKEEILKMWPTIKKICMRNKLTLQIKYLDYIIDNHFDQNDYHIPNIEKETIKELTTVLNLINGNDRSAVYSYIYDEVCQHLDKQFLNNDYCQFIDGKCINERLNNKKMRNCGCCYQKGKRCHNLLDGKCTIKCISCKLFTCRYLRSKGIHFKINNIPLLKYFFNLKQKYIFEYSIYENKETIIDKLK